MTNQEFIKKVADTVCKVALSYGILVHSPITVSYTHLENADELLIMDTNDKNTAKRVWRWNLNGLGYSKTGYKGSYELAMTMDGQILGTLIAGEAIKAEHISTEYKTSVERQITDAKEDVENNVQEELKSYWTKTEVETAINQSANSIKLSAKETRCV